MTITKQILTEAKALVTPIESWLRTGWSAEDGNGAQVSCESPEACRFCMMGAIVHVLVAHKLARGWGDGIAAYRSDLVSDAGSLFTFNDNATHAEVLAKFDELMERIPN
jgi:hypothetical protein